MEEKLTEGWGDLTPKKAHYYRDTMSLCGKRGFYRGPLELGDDDIPDNCAACVRKLRKEQEKAHGRV